MLFLVSQALNEIVISSNIVSVIYHFVLFPLDRAYGLLGDIPEHPVDTGNRRDIAVFMLAFCAAFLIGARLWNVAIDPDAYGADRPWYTMKMNGFSLYGGLAGALLVTLAAALLSRARLLKMLDAMTVPGAISFCIARVGCFLNGCCSGKKTDLPWGVIFPPEGETASSLIHTGGTAVHPTQLYELILALFGIPLCLLVIRKVRAGTGGRFVLYAVWFCILRLIVLPFRALPYPLLVRNVFYPALYYVLIVLGIFLFVWICRQEKS